MKSERFTAVLASNIFSLDLPQFLRGNYFGDKFKLMLKNYMTNFLLVMSNIWDFQKSGAEKNIDNFKGPEAPQRLIFLKSVFSA